MLCEALGLEFYVGPPRDAADSAFAQTIEKIAEALGLPPATGVDEVIEKIKSLNRWDPAALKAYLDQAEVALQKWQSETIDVVAEIVKEMKAAGQGTSVAQTARSVQARKVETGKVVTPPAHDLEDDSALAEPDSGKVLEFSEPDPDAEICGLPYRVNISGAAGPGAFVDDENVIKLIGFRRDWLRKHGINPDKCSLIDVLGNSMEPELRDKAIILIDHQRTRRLAGRIFAVRSDDGLQIKRLEHDNHDWLLVSDNNKEYKPVPWPREAVVIGQVMWTGRTL